MTRTIAIALPLAATFAMASCATHGHQHDHQDHAGHQHPGVAADPANGVVPVTATSPLVAVVREVNNSGVAGTVFFSPETVEGKSAVRVRGTVTGLTPNSKHGFHVHAYGDATDTEKGTSAGVHFNPFATQHVLGAAAHDHSQGHNHADHTMAHAGDFPNLEADGTGTATFSILSRTISLTTGSNAVLGRSLIIHEAEDVGTQPWGGAGGRIAIAIVGLANPDSLPAGAQ